MKRRMIYKLPHGWYKGGVLPLTYSPTIDTGIANWHTLILEVDDENKNAICGGTKKNQNFKITLDV